MKKIAINGFGRIGRAALKIIIDTPGLDVVAINDLMSPENAVYLLKHDSVYGKYENEVTFNANHLNINGKKILFLSEKDPSLLPWKNLDIDIVIESTGFFTKREDAEKHIYAGAKYVVISAPTKSKDTPTLIHGVNTLDGKTSVFSCASCTTNNIATIKALPQMEGKFDGVAIRTPVPVGSISDITFLAARSTSAEEINNILLEESRTDRYKFVLAVSDEPLVSSDIVESPFASVVDLEMTRVVDGDLVKIMAWYDNEWGFTNQMVRLILEI